MARLKGGSITRRTLSVVYNIVGMREERGGKVMSRWTVVYCAFSRCEKLWRGDKKSRVAAGGKREQRAFVSTGNKELQSWAQKGAFISPSFTNWGLEEKTSEKKDCMRFWSRRQTTKEGKKAGVCGGGKERRKAQIAAYSNPAKRQCWLKKRKADLIRVERSTYLRLSDADISIKKKKKNIWL